MSFKKYQYLPIFYTNLHEFSQKLNFNKVRKNKYLRYDELIEKAR